MLFFFSRYNHSSEDAEIYREFLDIATRVIPEIFRQCTLESRVGDRAHLNPLGKASRRLFFVSSSFTHLGKHFKILRIYNL